MSTIPFRKFGKYDYKVVPASRNTLEIHGLGIQLGRVFDINKFTTRRGMITYNYFRVMKAGFVNTQDIQTFYANGKLVGGRMRDLIRLGLTHVPRGKRIILSKDNRTYLRFPQTYNKERDGAFEGMQLRLDIRPARGELHSIRMLKSIKATLRKHGFVRVQTHGVYEATKFLEGLHKHFGGNKNRIRVHSVGSGEYRQLTDKLLATMTAKASAHSVSSS